MQAPILITGCARSGTSLVAGVVNICGAFGGNMSGPTPYNPKGMFENTHIRQKIVKPFLKRIGADPLGQSPLPSRVDMEIDLEWKKKIEICMLGEGYLKGPWFYKGAKMCLTWPLWDVAFPSAQWVLVRRPDKDIIRSCLRTGFMRAYKDEKGWQSWIDWHKECFDEMSLNCQNILEVAPLEEVKKPAPFKEFISFLGLDYDKSAVKNFVDPTLYRSAA